MLLLLALLESIFSLCVALFFLTGPPNPHWQTTPRTSDPKFPSARVFQLLTSAASSPPSTLSAHLSLSLPPICFHSTLSSYPYWVPPMAHCVCLEPGWVSFAMPYNYLSVITVAAGEINFGTWSSNHKIRGNMSSGGASFHRRLGPKFSYQSGWSYDTVAEFLSC
jgi:hypothetical protein